MQYRHAPDADYADLASGLVVRSAPGHPAFPVRLTVELFHRAVRCLPRSGPVTVWDPMCGSGQLLTTLGLSCRARLRGLLGSDAHAEPLAIAERNLALLTGSGLAARRDELAALANAHGKPAHATAVAAAGRLAGRLAADGGDLPCALHRVNALDPDALRPLAERHAPDIVIADVPHGQQTGWTAHHGRGGDAELIAALGAVLPAASVIVVVSRARRVPLPDGVAARERVRVGHRAGALVRAGDTRLR